MADAQDRLERLIGRRLDGEATAEDDRELDAMLAASPEARSLFESYERQDALVGSTLRHAFEVAPTPAAAVRVSTAEKHSATRAWSPARWPARLTVAAVITAAVTAAVRFGPGLRQDFSRPAGVASRTSPGLDTESQPPATAETLLAADDLSANETPGLVNREVLGVVGEDGQTIYLLEMDHTQTEVVPVGIAF